MSELFLWVINRGISAGWLVLAVLALRPALRPAPRWACLWLWGIVGLRLACPFSIESALSLIPSAETVPMNIEMRPLPAIESGVPAIDRAVNPLLGEAFTPAPLASANPLQIWVPLAAAVWLLGAAALLFYTVFSWLRLRRQLAGALRLEENIYESEAVSSPFVFGLLRPRIYLPRGLSEKDRAQVLAHERAHIRRCDHWWKPLGFLLLAVYWFHPLFWLAYRFFCRDIELACDERVIRGLDREERADYSQALLDCSVGHYMAACPLAFGEVGVKERVKSILRYRKPAPGAAAAGLAVCLLLAACFLCDPVTPDSLTLTERPFYGGSHAYTYRLDLGKKTQSARVWAEKWENGSCTASEPLLFSADTGEVRIRLDVRHEGDPSEGRDTGVEVSITDGRDASLDCYFPFPEEMRVVGWGSSGYELNQKVSAGPGSEAILAIMRFDQGSGIEMPGPRALLEEPGRLEALDCAVLIRAAFSGNAPAGTE